VRFDFLQARVLRNFGVEHKQLKYRNNPNQHVIAEVCASAGIAGEISLRPYVMLSSDERARGNRSVRPQVAIQSSNLGARYGMRNKQWYPDRFQTVVNSLGAEFDFVQLGFVGDPPLQGCLDLRGRTTLREAAGVLAGSRLFIGLEGGLMHLARAVDCRSVIIFGGHTRPDQIGYLANENLGWSGQCSPCWLENECDFDRTCMREISAEAVIEAARRQLALMGEPLAVDRVVIGKPETADRGSLSSTSFTP
jgi:ADP-heptose:LPS heptosyltransferase